MNQKKRTTWQAGILAILAAAALALAPIAAVAGSLDTDGRQLVTTATDRAAAHGEALCLTGAVVQVGGLPERRHIEVQNLGPNAVYLCPTSSCTAGDGLRLAPGASWPKDTRLPLYCRGSGADQVAGAGLRFAEWR